MSVNRFRDAQTQASVRRDFVEWHRGRSPYVFWALDVDLPAVRAEVARAEAYLAGFLLDDYARQPHVTLDLCGFPGVDPTAEDEFSAEFLARQWSALKAACLPEFEIEVGGLASFASAAFLQLVDCDSRIAKVRYSLAIDGQPRLFGDYVPHVTVGLYAGTWPGAEIAARLESFSGGGPVRCRIDRISLMAYQPSEIAGPLRCLADYRLASGDIDWHERLF